MLAKEVKLYARSSVAHPMLQTTHQSLLQKLATIALLETMLEYASVTIQPEIL